ncbi:Coenzyme F420 hydrogenase/dehydrogenase, beta subunit C-terminal domain [Desulfolutivibrio sulfoxidireducens]|uniref:Coenzyme F420 hydrogenase/dehydrogenase, beta subunit C-terminal domain n=1 Tax=Desulfolutivibrio sulfoxidireducens TaxID=2773299 RepID=UPI00159DBCCC|nr:Coenzyme F420 hydrogenase/dehydrogenase, beta subunit C-terminal domain [Desulfolutivibrio sulfoxidireducens]QLA16896.1 4Fe-4S dicluster domain-containing protein [Desulfolutivibrio sulfoxidireducens]QLA20462.1 4Fe-4S dicluster domain-containing protein [Desulfolutivibrio sulfoxidireducens]
MEKSFTNLIEEVQKPGLCHRCGGCVTFCSAINFGALELGPDGSPRYKDPEKCIECGICYMICPVNHELDNETRNLVNWHEPMGNVIGTTVARAMDPEVRAAGTDGGVVTAILLRLFDQGHIDGAIVCRQTGPFQRRPALARTREDILAAAGSHYDVSHGMEAFGGEYATYTTYSPSIQAFGALSREHLGRVAFVGTPCQVKTLRKMQAMGIVPSDAIKYTLGLFCTRNFLFGDTERARLEQIGGFSWDDIVKVNVRERLQIFTRDGEVKKIEFDKLDFMTRSACRYCDDYSAEYADLSFGGVGADPGWTTVISRTPLGRAALADARGTVIEQRSVSEKPKYASDAMAKVEELSRKKKAAAIRHRGERRVG